MTEAKTPHVYEAWAGVIADMARDGVSKDGTNEQQRYKFRGIDHVLNALAASYARHGLAVRCEYSNRQSVERATKNGGVQEFVTVIGEYTLVSTRDGSESRPCVFIGQAQDSADKATNKAMSAAYKYFAIQTFAIPTEGDNDADAHTHERAAPQSREQPVRDSQPKMDGYAITSGPAKGKRFTEATADELSAYGNEVVAVLDDKSKAQYHAKAQAIIDAIYAEFAARDEKRGRL